MKFFIDQMSLLTNCLVYMEGLCLGYQGKECITHSITSLTYRALFHAPLHYSFFGHNNHVCHNRWNTKCLYHFIQPCYYIHVLNPFHFHSRNITSVSITLHCDQRHSLILWMAEKLHNCTVFSFKNMILGYTFQTIILDLSNVNFSFWRPCRIPDLT